MNFEDKEFLCFIKRCTGRRMMRFSNGPHEMSSGPSTANPSFFSSPFMESIYKTDCIIGPPDC